MNFGMITISQYQNLLVRWGYSRSFAGGVFTTKFLLDHGTKITAEITSSHYCNSPLLQKGLQS